MIVGPARVLGILGILGILGLVCQLQLVCLDVCVFVPPCIHPDCRSVAAVWHRVLIPVKLYATSHKCTRSSRRLVLADRPDWLMMMMMEVEVEVKMVRR